LRFGDTDSRDISHPVLRWSSARLRSETGEENRMTIVQEHALLVAEKKK
jgi:hypothetical protein